MPLFRVEKFPNGSAQILLDSSQSYRLQADTERLAARFGLIESLKRGLVIHPDKVHSHQMLVSHWPDQDWSEEKFFFYIDELLTDDEKKQIENWTPQCQHQHGWNPDREKNCLPCDCNKEKCPDELLPGLGIRLRTFPIVSDQANYDQLIGLIADLEHQGYGPYVPMKRKDHWAWKYMTPELQTKAFMRLIELLGECLAEKEKA